MDKIIIRIIAISAIFAFYALDLYHLGSAIVFTILFILLWIVSGYLELNLSDKLAENTTSLLYSFKAKYYTYLTKYNAKRSNKEGGK